MLPKNPGVALAGIYPYTENISNKQINNWVNLIVSLHLIIRNICLFLIIAASVLCQCMYDNQSV